MTDLRRMFYNRYKTSSIFNTNNTPQTVAPIKNNQNQPSKPSYPITFSPKYDKMTSKERYWNEMRYNFQNKSSANSPKNNTRRSHSIKETRKQKELEEKKNNLTGIEIMCRDMYNGYDPQKYKIKRSKSTFYLRSYLADSSVNEKSTKYERSLAYTCSNIFNDKSKDKQIEQTFRESKENKENINNDKNYRPLKKQKSWSDFEKELTQRKLKFNHSKFTTDMDWKTTNTEDIRNDTESDFGSVLTDRSGARKSFRRVNILKREYIGDKKNKNKERDQNKESVKYNIISGTDRKNELSEKVYDKFNKEKPKDEEKIDYSRKKYDFKNNFLINKYQPSVEYYEIDIPKNFDLTDVNTIRNIFSSRGIHAFKIEESSNSVNNQSGKITLRIRKDNMLDDKDYNKNISNIKKLISKKDMKLNKVEGNKAKVSKIAKQRVKTPFKGEILLKPSDNPKSEKEKEKGKENKAKNNNESKKSQINIKTKSIKKTGSKINNKKSNIKLKK